MEILIYSLILIGLTMLLAGKDAFSYLLKDHISLPTPITKKREKGWHYTGAGIYALFVGMLVYYTYSYWEVPLLATLLRLSLYDVLFNKWSKLPITHIGIRSFWDRQFSKIFGSNGAIKKSLFFFSVFVVFIVIKLF